LPYVPSLPELAEQVIERYSRQVALMLNRKIAGVTVAMPRGLAATA
jgi:hypothetical protein